MVSHGKFVAYYRVSHRRGRGRSGLGLEAQRTESLRIYLDVARWRIVAEFTEVESGVRG